MSVRTIVIDGDPILRQRANEVDPAEIGAPDFLKLISDMVETMYAADGVGIAAPQIGVGKRIFIADSDHGPIALVNPVFKKISWKKINGEEGCLSVPGRFGRLPRAKSVSIEALTAEGKKISFAAHDFFARILQHEMDHLDGILFVDRLER